jgi:hypothetical protein
LLFITTTPDTAIYAIYIGQLGEKLKTLAGGNILFLEPIWMMRRPTASRKKVDERNGVP